MKILQLNNYHYLRGGVEKYYLDLSELLTTKGHQVVNFSSQHSNNLPNAFSDYFVRELNINKSNLFGKLRDLKRIFYSRESSVKLDALLENERPDIAHLHNIYTVLSPSVLASLKRHKIPMILTLHDYKLVCPTMRFYSKDRICEQCRKYHYYYAIINRCWKDSLVLSTLYCLEAYYQDLTNAYQKNVDAMVAPSLFLKQKLSEHGIDGSSILHLPNFLPDKHFSNEPLPTKNVRGEYLLYVGRLSAEKGIADLIKACLPLKDIKLLIAGEGPIRQELETLTKKNKNIIFLGYQQTNEIELLLRQALFVIVPSRCHENFPYSILEAFASSKPVVAARVGGIPELVKPEINGLFFKAGNINDLQERILYLLSNRDLIVKMGKQAKIEAQKYTAEAHYQALIKIYCQLVGTP